MVGVVLTALVFSGFAAAPKHVTADSAVRTLTLHFSKDANITDETVWSWGDLPEQNGNWPQGKSLDATSDADYPHSATLVLNDDAKVFNFLIVKADEEKKTGDVSIELLTQEMTDVYLDKDFNVFYTANRVPEGKVRIHYQDDQYNYKRDHVYVYGLLSINGNNEWGTFLELDKSTLGPNGIYGEYDYNDTEDVKNNKTGFFNLVNGNDGDRSYEHVIKEVPLSRELFVREGDETLYDNPYYVTKERMTGAEQVSTSQIQLSFNNITQFDVKDVRNNLVFYNGNDVVSVDDYTVSEGEGVFLIEGDFETLDITHLELYGVTLMLMKSWKYMDSTYFYEGDLGATLHDDGSATLKLWSPSADGVRVKLYDRDDQTKWLQDIAMTQIDGVWEVTLNASNTGIDNLRNYVYHYAIEREGTEFITLDPYAKSLSQWNSDNAQGDKIAKAAIVNPSEIGPELDYADIEGYKTREDAIIYELHVRDFTSDPNLEGELKAQFGTFASFVEKLDYLEDLGVTHVQLLPIMSYYFANEFNTKERMLDYESENTDYNWGYDPQSYFALTGMYSEDASNPEKRIEEFKNLVNEIHERGMGVILDVVYNHTARTEIFEDLEPNYYHFMDRDGTARTSFGGGRLGTSHLMSRRILVDSILYMVEEYKVDGFRFDMMGDHDAETIQIAFDEAQKLNPNILMIGEGWVTYAGDEGESLQAADQQWMQYTQAVGSFSDEIRNELKSGFGSEGQPRFLTNGARSTQVIYNNMIARPGNFLADDPGDVVQYIEAHDNLTLYDVIAQSIKKDPKYHDKEILERVRLGNTMVLTSQGTAFLHGGQEYGRTKQFLADTTDAPYKSTYMVNADGTPFDNPYFIHDSYDSSDIINRFDWDKATNEEAYPLNVLTRNHMKGLISIRRSTDAFTYPTTALIDQYVSQVLSDDIKNEDLVLAMKNISAETTNVYYTFVNADDVERTINFKDESLDLDKLTVISNGEQVDLAGLINHGVVFDETSITLDPLSSVIIKITNKEEVVEPGEEETPETPETPGTPNDKDDSNNNDSDNTVDSDDNVKGPEDNNDSKPATPEKPETPESSVTPDNKLDTDSDTLPSTGVNTSAVFAFSGLFLLAGFVMIKRNRIFSK